MTRSEVPDTAGVRHELAQLVASDEFRNSERHRAVLRFLVDRALDGRAPAKEYEIGVEVLGRPVNYDSRTDPIVRVEMRQLRLKLARHYATASHGPIRIDVPKGRYEATFSHVEPLVPSAAVATLPEPAGSPASRPWSGRNPGTAVAALVIATVAVIGWSLAGRLGSSSLPVVEVEGPSLAVLPFVNLSGDPQQEYFSDGLTEEVMSSLMRVDGLRIVGRTSAFSFKSSGAPVDEIARRLGVHAVLSGSVRRDRTRVRVIATLRDAAGLQYWSRTFDVEMTEPVAVQEQIATAVAGALTVRIDPTSGQSFVKRSNDDPAAYDLYLKARSLASSRNAPDLLASIQLFQQAIDRDPGYALAYAGLADAHGVLAFNGQVLPDEAIAKARAAAAQALRLDPTLGEAVAHLASLDAFVDWNWPAAEQGFKRALALTPSHPRIHAWYGQVFLAQGKFAEAIEELQIAQRLDPLASSIGYALGEAYLYCHRADAAITQARRLIAADAASWGGHNLLARAAMQTGRREEALGALRQSRGELWADVLALVAAGERARARQVLDDRSPSIAAQQPFVVASLYAQAGDEARALYWLEQAFELRQIDLAYLAVDPGFASLRTHPDYQALVSRLGLKVDFAAGGGG
jgi:TolB-like protein/Flp pilus assembly protein TadD